MPGDLYHIYKPLRNKCREYNLWSGIVTCHQLVQFLDFNKPLPGSMNAPPMHNQTDRIRSGLFQWEIEILIRELVLNGDPRAGKELREWKDIANLVNQIKHIEDDKWANSPKEEGDILYELVRIAHRQFPWQTGINREFIARYHWLYSQDGLREYILKNYGMSPSQLLQISLALSGHFLKNPITKIPLNNFINKVSSGVIQSFIDRISISYEDLRSEYLSLSEYNINWAYTLNPLRRTPLILQGSICICPIPTFLLRRITSEIYFDLVSDNELMSKYFGPAVQALIGKAAKFYALKSSLSLLEETRFGPKGREKDSIDWIISDQTGHIFIECKGARVKYKGISDLTNRESIISEFKRIQKFAVQAYKTLNLALSGQYPHWKDDGKPRYVVIVTLEDWQSFGIHVEKHVLAPLRNELHKLGIPPSIIDENPLSFCAIADFEAAVHTCAERGISTVLGAKAVGQYQQWSMGVFLQEEFKDSLIGFTPQAFADQLADIASSTGHHK